jgi:hypothetical protein
VSRGAASTNITITPTYVHDWTAISLIWITAVYLMKGIRLNGTTTVCVLYVHQMVQRVPPYICQMVQLVSTTVHSPDDDWNNGHSSNL